MFDIFTKEVEINGTVYNIKPLKGEHIQRFYKLISALNVGENVSEEEASTRIMDSLKEEAGKDIHFLALETLKTSYPDVDVDKLDMFVSQNLMQLVQPLVEVNINSNAMKNVRAA